MWIWAEVGVAHVRAPSPLSTRPGYSPPPSWIVSSKGLLAWGNKLVGAKYFAQRLPLSALPGAEGAAVLCPFVKSPSMGQAPIWVQRTHG